VLLSRPTVGGGGLPKGRVLLALDGDASVFGTTERETLCHNQLAWVQHPAIWLCESYAILWLVVRAVRSPWVRVGVLLMLCGLLLNALVTDANAGTMPVVGNARHTASRKSDVAGCKRGHAITISGRSSAAWAV
jgi:hypothetical protein